MGFLHIACKASLVHTRTYTHARCPPSCLRRTRRRLRRRCRRPSTGESQCHPPRKSCLLCCPRCLHCLHSCTSSLRDPDPLLGCDHIPPYNYNHTCTCTFTHAAHANSHMHNRIEANQLAEVEEFEHQQKELEGVCNPISEWRTRVCACAAQIACCSWCGCWHAEGARGCNPISEWRTRLQLCRM